MKRLYTVLSMILVFVVLAVPAVAHADDHSSRATDGWTWDKASSPGATTEGWTWDE